MKVTSIDLTKLRNAEFIQFVTNTLQIVTNNNPTLLKVADEATALQAELTKISNQFKTDKGSNLTPLIEELDATRDGYLVGISKTTDGLSYHFTPAKQNAAKELINYLKIYGAASDVALSSLQAETATITNMVNDLTTKPELVAALAELGLTAWVAELGVVNTNFNTKYLERTAELGTASSTNIKDLRVIAVNKYNEFKDMIEGQATVSKGASIYETTINQLNALVNQYNATLAARAGRVEVSKDEEKPIV